VVTQLEGREEGGGEMEDCGGIQGMGSSGSSFFGNFLVPAALSVLARPMALGETCCRRSAKIVEVVDVGLSLGHWRAKELTAVSSSTRMVETL
jgi:hypothetical protein